MDIKKSVALFFVVELLYNIIILISALFSTNEYVKLSIQILCSLISIGASFLFAYLVKNKNTEKNDFKEYLSQYKKRVNPLIFLLVIIVVLSVLPFSFLVQGAINEGLKNIGYKTSSTVDSLMNNNLLSNPNYITMLIITIAFVIPIREEIVFRTFLARGFRDFGIVFAIIASSFVFGFVHGGIDQFFPQLFLAILIAIIYFKTESIYTTITMHIINNLTAVLLFKYEDKIINSGIYNNLVVIAISGLVIMIACMFLINFISKKSKHKEEYQIYKGFLYHKDALERTKTKKGLFDYIAPTSVILITLLMWIISTLQKTK